jgi:hypothetical protein
LCEDVNWIECKNLLNNSWRASVKTFMNFSVVVWGSIRTIEELLIRTLHEIPFVLELRGNQLSFKFMIFDYITLSDPSILVCYAVSIGKQVSLFQRILIF